MKDRHEEWLDLCTLASEEQDGERLFQLVRRINELLEAKEKSLQASSAKPVSKDNRVFQIAYDEGLLYARAELLKKREYDVTSVFVNDEAKRVLAQDHAYRVFIVGHAAPKPEREEMVRWLKASFPTTKILVLNPPHGGDLVGADFNFLLNGLLPVCPPIPEEKNSQARKSRRAQTA